MWVVGGGHTLTNDKARAVSTSSHQNVLVRFDVVNTACRLAETYFGENLLMVLKSRENHNF